MRTRPTPQRPTPPPNHVSDLTADHEIEVEIDLDDLDWSTPAEWEDSPPALAAVLPLAPEPATTKPADRPAPPPPAATPRPPSTSSAPALPPAFARVVGRAGPAPLREIVGVTFARLLRALDTLGVIEKALTRSKAVRVGLLFEEVRAQSVALLALMNEAVPGEGAPEQRARDALDGASFVIGHELTKVFRQEFPGIADEGRHSYSRTDFSRAWGLLHNCLQQTAITLAQAFDPSVTGEHLFEDYRSKVENSLTLYRELHALLRKVNHAEHSSGILLKHSLVRHLAHFREETMPFLMYKDWGEFGRYVDEVTRAFEEMEEFETMLHEFAQYLRTLIHHVGMREVLRGATPAGA
jgi:hypothetical protein